MMSGVKAASAASLLQVMRKAIPARAQVRNMVKDFVGGSADAHTKSVIKAFLSVDDGQDPAAPVYESQAGGVVELMKDLAKKLVSEKTVLEQQEIKSVGAFNMIAQTLNDQIASMTATRDKKLSDKQTAEKDSAQAAGQKVDTENAKAADSEYLKELKADCAEKAKEFEAKQKLRAGELEALNKAIQIMAGAAVGKVGFVQKKRRASALVQLRSGNSATAPTQRVQAYLLSAGQKLNSNILSALAMRVGQDPLAKVKKMIQDMVYKLMEEANEEAEHKGFCDTEMGTNKNTRDEKSEKVEKLTALIEELKASITKLGEASSIIGDAISAIDAAMAKATAERNEESAKNKAVIADAKVAGEATAQALTVLKEFYAKAQGASFFQKPYTGMAGGGVVGMLEVIQSDFVRLETETTSAEDNAAKAFTDFSRDSSKDKAIKEMDLKHAQNSKTEKESDLAAAEKDLKGTQEELDAAMAYFEKLKPSCVDAGQSYEERVAQRKAEIESLQDAFKILNGEA